MDTTLLATTVLVGTICSVLGYILGGRAERRHYCFRVTSFFEKKKRKIPGIRSESYQIGYRAQLHVKGFPCLEPHRVILEESKELDCDPAEIGRSIREIVRAAVAAKTYGIPYVIEGALGYDSEKESLSLRMDEAAKASRRKTR